MATLLSFPPNSPGNAPAFATVELCTDKVAVLQHIWVDDRYRGRGHGKGLLAQVVSELRARGVSRLYTHPSPGYRNPCTTKITATAATADAHNELVAWCERHGFSRLTPAEVEEIAGLGTWVRTI